MYAEQNTIWGRGDGQSKMNLPTHVLIKKETNNKTRRKKHYMRQVAKNREENKRSRNITRVTK